MPAIQCRFYNRLINTGFDNPYLPVLSASVTKPCAFSTAPAALVLLLQYPYCYQQLAKMSLCMLCGMYQQTQQG